MTFDEIIEEANSVVKDRSTAGNAAIKKGINAGLTRLRAKLKRSFTTVTRRIYFRAGQTVYQMPENAIRFASLHYVDGGERTPIFYKDNENNWDAVIGQAGGGGGRPEFVRMVGPDLFEVYPAPSSDSIGEIKYQARAKRLSAEDYTVGTVTVVNGSQTVVGTGTSWTDSMVERSIKLETSKEDSTDYYRVISVESATSLTIENYYDGPSESAKTYRIGEVPNIPEEYHPSLADYGDYYFYLWRKDKDMAQEFNASFMQSMQEITVDYSGPTVSNVIQSKKLQGGDAILPNYKQGPRYQ